MNDEKIEAVWFPCFNKICCKRGVLDVDWRKTLGALLENGYYVRIWQVKEDLFNKTINKDNPSFYIPKHSITFDPYATGQWLDNPSCAFMKRIPGTRTKECKFNISNPSKKCYKCNESYIPSLYPKPNETWKPVR